MDATIPSGVVIAIKYHSAPRGETNGVFFLDFSRWNLDKVAAVATLHFTDGNISGSKPTTVELLSFNTQ